MRWYGLGVVVMMIFMVPLQAQSEKERLWQHHFKNQAVYLDYPRRLLWQDSASTASKQGTHDEAKAYCAGLKHAKLSQWRLPGVGELKRLFTQKSRLTYVSSSSYWTSTPVEMDGMTYFGGVRFRRGTDGHANPKNRLFIRCVHDVEHISTQKQSVVAAAAVPVKVQPVHVTEEAKKYSNELKQANEREEIMRARAEEELWKKAEATALAAKQAEEARAAKKAARDAALRKVTLKDRTLLWQDTVETMQLKLNWKQASAYCKRLELAQFSDWRMPSLKELRALYEKRTKLRHVTDKFYWSGDVEGKLAEYVHFNSGEHFRTYKTRKNCVRCVRNR